MSKSLNPFQSLSFLNTKMAVVVLPASKALVCMSIKITHLGVPGES